MENLAKQKAAGLAREIAACFRRVPCIAYCYMRCVSVSLFP